MIKLCKDCKWVRNPGEFAKCANPKSQRNRATSGMFLGGSFSGEAANDFCALSRDEGYIGAWNLVYCGRHARWFEPKDVA